GLCVCARLFLRKRANHPIISGWIQWVRFLSVLISYPRRRAPWKSLGSKATPSFPHRNRG
uniref:Uncharacterized protein n=1 Tax=Aegilops tauschii subsp. strangulata TaxID=200361 RepID=A0A452YJ01_AEGTS